MVCPYACRSTLLYGTKNFSSPMSQKPSARRRAMVRKRALAILIGTSRGRASKGFSLNHFRNSRAGGKPESTGGPPEARLVCRGRGSIGTAVAWIGSKADWLRGAWRAEGGPRMRGVRPRLLFLTRGEVFSFEGLVLAEIGDAQSQGVDRNKFVGHLALKNEDKVRRV